MNHKAVRDLLNDTLKSLDPSVSFGYGRLSDFNKIRDKKYPYVWSDVVSRADSYTDNAINLTNTYTVTLSFLDKDETANDENQTNPILDAMSNLSESFIHKLNLSDFDESELATLTSMIQITNIQHTRVIKDHADILSGWVVSFNLITPDDFDYCSIYD